MIKDHRGRCDGDASEIMDPNGVVGILYHHSQTAFAGQPVLQFIHLAPGTAVMVLPLRSLRKSLGCFTDNDKNLTRHCACPLEDEPTAVGLDAPIDAMQDVLLGSTLKTDDKASKIGKLNLDGP